jgi:hypothetical protein
MFFRAELIEFDKAVIENLRADETNIFFLILIIFWSPFLLIRAYFNSDNSYDNNKYLIRETSRNHQ